MARAPSTLYRVVIIMAIVVIVGLSYQYLSSQDSTAPISGKSKQGGAFETWYGHEAPTQVSPQSVKEFDSEDTKTDSSLDDIPHSQPPSNYTAPQSTSAPVADNKPVVTPITDCALPNNSRNFSAEWENELFNSYTMSMLTTRKLHDRIKWLRWSWWEPKYDPLVDVLSDTSEMNTTWVLPNILNTGCDDSYNDGLWCKNRFMLQRWKTDPKFKNVKWFYRTMDDSWVHLENAVWLTRQFDHTKKIIIGERVCFWTNNPYPDGGPGFFISRGVIDSPTLLDTWNKTLELNKPHGVYDDVIWGLFAQQEGITLHHYTGISHTHMSNESALFRYYTHQKNHRWPLSWRPVAYHQEGHRNPLMPEVNRQLHEIDYGNLAENLVYPPNCLCARDKFHSKCGYDVSFQVNNHPCKWSTGNMTCIAPGPFPNTP